MIELKHVPAELGENKLKYLQSKTMVMILAFHRCPKKRQSCKQKHIWLARCAKKRRRRVNLGHLPFTREGKVGCEALSYSSSSRIFGPLSAESESQGTLKNLKTKPSQARPSISLARECNTHAIGPPRLPNMHPTQRHRPTNYEAQA